VVLNLIAALAFNAKKVDHTTPAVLFRVIDGEHPCILLDEADNADLPTTAALRAVVNSGHHCDGKVSRYLEGEEGLLDLRTAGARRHRQVAPPDLAPLNRAPHGTGAECEVGTL
jgi:hypothetical protein